MIHVRLYVHKPFVVFITETSFSHFASFIPIIGVTLQNFRRCGGPYHLPMPSLWPLPQYNKKQAIAFHKYFGDYNIVARTSRSRLLDAWTRGDRRPRDQITQLFCLRADFASVARPSLLQAYRYRATGG